MAGSKFHPFITFEFNVSVLKAPDIWLMFGEAMSKCQHLAGAPLKPDAAAQLSSVYLARGVQATTAIEGNTLSEEEVKRIVDEGTADVSESRSYLEREAQNVLAAVRDIDAALRAGARLPITVERLCDLNGRVLKGVPDKPEVVPGAFRQHTVRVGTYRAPDWNEVAELTEQFVDWLARLRSDVTTDSRREDRFVNAVLSAILAHLYIAWIHPFGNGNGRLARLVEVQILSESGVIPLVSTNLLSDHYNKTRNAYYLALDAAQSDVSAFIRYAMRGFVDELRGQIDTVRDYNLQIHWESYVYSIFKLLPHTDARDRQRELALSIPRDSMVTPESVPLLTTSLAQKYGACGPRTPARDLNALVQVGLVEKLERRHYRARHEVIEAFIPPTAP